MDLTEGEKSYKLLLGDYVKTDGFSRPTRMKFLEKQSNLEVDLSISEIKKLDNIAPSTFDLVPPPGVEVRSL